ncbi:ribosome maturation factor RimM [Thermobifida halotolerans]|uniref:Ribosome maturation factor RimM n=1 Tax=Thermobifida halotolerans TaxID=483545 RepID=A0A399G2E2_9ACTN|nr:ribosome maturation factor RimM [Thermobifida halotolerans]UOE19746.1 ribosome maturation factor RimM [Thermobifida halotolerans]
MRLVVGRIGRPHGVRGEVAVEVRTDTPEERFLEGAVLDTDPADAGPLTITAVRRHGGRLLVRFGGIADRTAAEGLRGVFLVVDSADLPPLDDPDEFHDHELIGLRVETTDGAAVGSVADILHHAQDTLVVRGERGGEVLVPFVRELVPEVDTGAGRILIDPPPGLLELGQ